MQHCLAHVLSGIGDNIWVACRITERSCRTRFPLLLSIAELPESYSTELHPDSWHSESRSIGPALSYALALLLSSCSMIPSSWYSNQCDATSCAIKRRPRLAAKYDSEATHSVTNAVRRYIAVDIEIPIPVPIAR